MLVPISWLREYVDITLPIPKLAERLTLAGLEEASLTNTGEAWEEDKIVVGQVVAVLPHPDADRLVQVDVSHENSAESTPQRVVTGAPNLFQFKGQTLKDGSLPTLKVAFAREGALLTDAYSDKRPRPQKRLKKAKIRGVESRGMVCSELELGLSEEHEGILLLPEDAPVAAPLSQYLGEEILEIDLTPDMARCLSIWGIAREVHALTGGGIQLPESVDSSSGEGLAADFVTARIEDPDLCHRFTGTVLRDITVGPSPKWIQDRLTAAGMRPINNVVDITNYVMLETGQPLHAFDYDLLLERAVRIGDTKPAIIVRTAAKGEVIQTLDGQKRELDPAMLVIADKAGAIAIAGVMGGAETEVHEGSRNILLESATFDGINNRRTSQTLRLHSVASYLFTRGVPATLNDKAARRAADLMRQYAGGRIVPGIVDSYPVPQPEITVYTSRSDVQRLLGLNLSLSEIGDALRRLGFGVQELVELPTDITENATLGLARSEGESVIAATVPWHRLDVTLPADLAEEVARVVGYDQISETLLDTVLPPQRRNALLETEENIRDILIGCGLQDTVNHTLTTPENHFKLLARGSKEPAVSVIEGDEAAVGDFITLTNPLSPERRVLRRNLFVSALENLAFNSRYAERLAVFEIGRTYRPRTDAAAQANGNSQDALLPDEERKLCVALRGPRSPHRSDPSSGEAAVDTETFDFFDLKGIVETLLERLGYAPESMLFSAHPESGTGDDASDASFGPRCALVTLQGEPWGIVGELHPQVRNAFGLGDERVVLAELSIAPLVRPSWRISPMAPISVYPPVVEDLAFVVREEVTQRRLRDAILKGGGKDSTLSSVELFDIYRGESLPVGYKSLAYRVTYQSLDHNLKEKEVSRLRQRIIRNVERVTEGKLRS